MELVKMIRENVIRIVPSDKVAQREKEGFKKVSEDVQAPSKSTKGGKDKPDDNKDKPDGDKDNPDGTQDGSNNPDAQAPNNDGEKTGEKFTAESLNEKTVNELRKIAKELGITGYANMSKETLIGIIIDLQE